MRERKRERERERVRERDDILLGGALFDNLNINASNFLSYLFLYPHKTVSQSITNNKNAEPYMTFY